MDLTFLLKSCKLFSDLDQRELEAIQTVAVRRDYRKAQAIFNETDASHGFFVLVAQHRILTYRGSQLKILNRLWLQRIAAGEERI